MSQIALLITCHTLTLLGIKSGGSRLELPTAEIEEGVVQHQAEKLALEECGFICKPRYNFEVHYGTTQYKVYTANLVYFPPVRLESFLYLAWFPFNQPKKQYLQPESYFILNRYRKLECSSV